MHLVNIKLWQDNGCQTVTVTSPCNRVA